MSRLAVTKLTVIAIAGETSKLTRLVQTLEQQNYLVLAALENTTSLCEQAQRHKVDVIIIEKSDPGQQELNAITRLGDEAPTPVVMFSMLEDAEYIADAIQAGVDAYIVDSMSELRLNSAIQIAKARFKGTQALLSEVNRMKDQLQERRVIERAKGLIMKSQGCDEPAAYQALRKLAMDRSQRIFDVAKNVISIMDLMKTV